MGVELGGILGVNRGCYFLLGFLFFVCSFVKKKTMSEIIRTRKIRPSSRNEKSKSYKIDTEKVTANDSLIVEISHESKPFLKTYKFNGIDVAYKSSISFRVLESEKSIEILWSGAKPINSHSKEKTIQLVNSTAQIANVNILQLVKTLMNEKNFKSADGIDNLVPKKSGLYCIRISDINKLSKPFNTFLAERRHNIIYIGIATTSLHQRFLNQELRANGHGTFFRSIGAMLGHRPSKGSLTDKANKRNYKFSSENEQKIIKWINDSLKVNWIEFNNDFEALETELINKYKPLLNLAKNPLALKELSDLRKECVRIANEQN